MRRHGRWLRRLGAFLLLVLLPGLGGCMSCLHPIDAVPKERLAMCQGVPPCCRNHVHVFFIHGLDPLDYANLRGVRDYVQTMGFIKTHFGQLYHVYGFESDIRTIHREDPEARFVLVGFSFGANMVRDLANAVRDEGIGVDLLVYLGGNTLENTPPNRPENVGRIVNILATGWIWHGATLDGAENYQYGDVWHFGSPSHANTLDVLARELTAVAARVPVVGPAVEGQAPPARAGGERGEWDFLSPDGEPGPPAGGAPGGLAGEGPPATMDWKGR